MDHDSRRTGKAATLRATCILAAAVGAAIPCGSESPISKPAAPAPRQGHALVAEKGGRLHLIGGNDGARILWEHWIYDIARGSWEQLPFPAEVRPLNSMDAVNAGGRIVVIGSYPEPISARRGPSVGEYPQTGTEPRLMDSVYIYEPCAAAWRVYHPRPAPSDRLAYSIAALPDGKVLLFGGEELLKSGWSDRNDTWLLDPSSGTWSLVETTDGPSARRLAVVGSIAGGRLVLAGGSAAEDELLTDSWEYDPEARSWTQIASANAPAFAIAAGVSLPDGSFILQRQLVTLQRQIVADQYPGDLWRYDPAWGKWEESGCLECIEPRQSPLAAIGEDIWMFSGSRGEELYFGLEVFGPDGR
ncbi:MAG: kelch repeat-containing protein [Spirochaetaceae bacterium]|nr:kelch repeat-containing protein [Spirochaetaceae bacterium]